MSDIESAGDGSWVANMYGENAFLDNLKRDDCPYESGTIEHACWHVGYTDQETKRRLRAEANEFRAEPFTVHYVETFTAELAEAMNRAQNAIAQNLNTELYGDAWYLQPHKPKSWLLFKVKAIRHYIGEKIADIASFVAGYDVRGDW